VPVYFNLNQNSRSSINSFATSCSGYNKSDFSTSFTQIVNDPNEYVVIISWHKISRKGKELISKKGFVHVPVGASTKGGASSEGVVNSHTNVPCVLPIFLRVRCA
jgi:hypothetical protein